MLADFQAIVKPLSLGAFSNGFVSCFSFCGPKRLMPEDGKFVLSLWKGWQPHSDASIYFFVSRVSSDVSSFIPNLSNLSLLPHLIKIA